MSIRDLLLFITGVVGVSLLVVVTLFLSCPTPNQEQTLTIALGLMAALVASGIPGVFNLKLGAVPTLPIQAGGAIVVFVLVVWFKPAAMAATPAEMQFSNSSCQGQVPMGKDIKLDKLPSRLDPNQQHVSPESSYGRPVKFTFDYSFGEFAGPREWTQVRPGVWIELYPSGDLFSAFREVGQQQLFECNGTVVQQNDGSNMQIFIPNKGCDKRLWFKVGEGEWAYLGEMKSVN